MRRGGKSRWFVFLPALMLGAGGAGGANPFASFESRCAQLPAPRFAVIEVPVSYSEDGSQSIDDLTLKSGDTPEMRITFGLTTAHFGHKTEYVLRSVDDPGSGRTCGTPTVQVEVSMQPMMVFIADELRDAPCPRAVTFSHEMKHVAVFRQTLDDVVRDLRADLPERLGAGMRRASSQAELERQFKAAFDDYLGSFFHRWHGALTERQAAVDSPQEYTRVKNACP